MRDKVKINVDGNTATLYKPSWDKVATVTVREDYIDELKSITWTKNNNYLHNKKYGYLHCYIMKKWYGENEYNAMHDKGFIVDHIDNNGFNCCINNLCFLSSDENKAKGMTLDKRSAKHEFIALSIYKDFDTQLFQVTIFFNYPAISKIECIEKPAVIDLAYLLYDTPYEIVINDAIGILLEYENYKTFSPDKLNFCDYHIEGCYGKPYPIELYNEYLEGKHGTICLMVKSVPIPNWSLDTKQKFLHIREK